MKLTQLFYIGICSKQGDPRLGWTQRRIQDSSGGGMWYLAVKWGMSSTGADLVGIDWVASHPCLRSRPY